MTKDELIEALALMEHVSWARWMVYLFDQSIERCDGTVEIPADLVERWRRQAETPYGSLTEHEKQSDRAEVAHILPIIEAYAESRRYAALLPPLLWSEVIMLRSKHPSDRAFEAWVDDADGGATDILRQHVVQAGFRGGWNAATVEQDKILSALVQLLAVVNLAVLEDRSKHRVANRTALPALVAREVIFRHGLEQDLKKAVQTFQAFESVDI